VAVAEAVAVAVVAGVEVGVGAGVAAEVAFLQVALIPLESMQSQFQFLSPIVVVVEAATLSLLVLITQLEPRALTQPVLLS